MTSWVELCAILFGLLWSFGLVILPLNVQMFALQLLFPRQQRHVVLLRLPKDTGAAFNVKVREVYTEQPH